MIFKLLRFVIVDGQVKRCVVTFKAYGQDEADDTEIVSVVSEGGEVLPLIKYSEIEMLANSVTYAEWYKVIDEYKQEMLEFKAEGKSSDDL